MAGQPGFFDADERYRALTAAGPPLEQLAGAVDFELFRAELDAALQRSDRGKGGRPPYDPVLMFKALIPQALYTLSDEQTEYQLRDRLIDRFALKASVVCPSRVQASRAAASRSAFQRQGSSRSSSWALVRPETMRSSTSVNHAKGSTPFSLAVATRLATSAQCRAPPSEPANRAFFLPRAIGRMARSMTFVSSSIRPSSRNSTNPGQWRKA
jgi:hypothetical protein